jgi:hypothetical protein
MRPRGFHFLVALIAAAAAIPALTTSSASRGAEKPAAAAAEQRLFEVRTNVAAPGKLDALHARFRNHTTRFFEKHGMTLVGLWTPAQGEVARNTLVYILAYPNKEARERSWKALQDDPEWQRVRAESEKDGPLLQVVESVYLKPADYSPIQ